MRLADDGVQRRRHDGCQLPLHIVQRAALHAQHGAGGQPGQHQRGQGQRDDGRVHGVPALRELILGQAHQQQQRKALHLAVGVDAGNAVQRGRCLVLACQGVGGQRLAQLGRHLGVAHGGGHALTRPGAAVHQRQAVGADGGRAMLAQVDGREQRVEARHRQVHAHPAGRPAVGPGHGAAQAQHPGLVGATPQRAADLQLARGLVAGAPVGIGIGAGHRRGQQQLGTAGRRARAGHPQAPQPVGVGHAQVLQAGHGGGQAAQAGRHRRRVAGRRQLLPLQRRGLHQHVGLGQHAGHLRFQQTGQILGAGHGPFTLAHPLLPDRHRRQQHQQQRHRQHQQRVRCPVGAPCLVEAVRGGHRGQRLSANARRSACQPRSLSAARRRCSAVVVLCNWAMSAQLATITRWL